MFKTLYLKVNCFYILLFKINQTKGGREDELEDWDLHTHTID